MAPYLGAGQGAAPAASSGSATPTVATGQAGGSAGPGAGPEAGAGAQASAAGSSGPAAAPSGGGGNGAGFNFDPAAEAAACPAGPGNAASAPGVTPTSVTVGNVSGLTGVVANTFPAGEQSVQALFKAIDAHGGICGRQLVLDVEDDGQDSSHHAADVADLTPRVLAFVGSTSDGDNGGVQTMEQAAVPDIGFAINPQRSGSSVYWSSSGSSEMLVNGRPYGWDTLEKGLVAYHRAPKRLAVLSYNIPVSSYGANIFSYGMSHYAGSSICFTDESISPATASLDQDVLEMRQKGCDGVYTTMDTTGNAKLLQALQRQNFHPPFVASTGAAYSPSLISVAGAPAAQGFQLYLWSYPLEETGNAMVRMYESQMATYEPGQQTNFFGTLAWADAQMFVYCLIHAGRNPTRASLTSQLSALSGWDTGGMFSPTTPKLRQTPGRCIVNMVVQGNGFARQWPALPAGVTSGTSGMYCNGDLVPLG
ncbi:MAG TPA: ABC transporter substrate-binding protein [Acidimicrobiales bacterium]|nr:ABC transporter substrate-binding protein [Acidimicrobiales bacterium]